MSKQHPFTLYIKSFITKKNNYKVRKLFPIIDAVSQKSDFKNHIDYFLVPVVIKKSTRTTLIILSVVIVDCVVLKKYTETTPTIVGYSAIW